ncbi:SWIM zinc finger [Parafrankia irregularis]|uniref:SWIM zinc finger n=1 Tax=Parafrankia irregularis TaxID=795642 RepID=A0A0S4QIP8_9ACTN|nr:MULTISPECIES: DEAD/DEAH box helicase [Parafrankia]MBE3205676.1 DEAD/DEAH box helicase [Parafrankia sp. CH37]CUU55424.1 SWIM zinc finger [Parafrankia irregularis]
MLPAELRDVDRGHLRVAVGDTTYRRGLGYAQEGAVLQVSWRPAGNTLAGVVAGSHAERYLTTVQFTGVGSGEQWWFEGGRCTCPVGLDCKHAVALVLAAATRAGDAGAEARADSGGAGSGGANGAPARRAGATDPRDWASSLSALIGERSATNEPHGTTPLAIELTLSAEPAGVPAARSSRGGRGRRRSGGRGGAGHGAGHGDGLSVGVRARLVKAGKTGWINALPWSRLNSPYGAQRDDYLPAHLRILREMYAVYLSGQEETGYGAYVYGDVKYLDLGAFTSPRLWPLLDEAAAAGVRLVHGNRRLGDIERYGSVELCLDVTSSDADAEGEGDIEAGAAELTVAPLLFLTDVDADLGGDVDADADAAFAVATIAFIGDHGVVGIDGAEIAASDRPEDWNLRLVRLSVPASAALIQMTMETEVLRIPAAEQPRFVEEFYPRLRRVARIISSDGSFEPPVITPPELVLRADFGPSHAVEIAWEWAYTVGGTRQRTPLASDSAVAGGFRDEVAEAEILAGLRLPPGSTALLAPGGGGYMPRSPGDEYVSADPVRLAGVETMRFATGLLPQLTGVDGLTVEVGGRPADYREAGELLRIEVSTDDVPGETDWFDLGVAVTLAGREIPFAALLAALSRQESYLLLDDGAYLSLDRPDLRALRTLVEEAKALRDAPGAGSGSDGELRISRFQAGLWEELTGIGVVVRQAEAWRRQVSGLLALDAAGAKEPPDTLQATLRPYQADGFRWLTFLWGCQLGGILADDMGLGKTVQSLALICHARETDPGQPPFLIVAPTSVVANWAAEAARFAPSLRVAAITDTLRRRGGSLPEIIAGADVVVTSYTLFRLDNEAYSAVSWAGLVLDEAQTVKNHQSKAYQCARLLPAPFKLAVTGTPLENNVMELWSLLSITAPGLFPNRGRFDAYYARRIEKQGDAERLAQLRRRIRPLMLRRTKEQVAPELPAKQEQILEVELHTRHRRIYQTHLQRERQKILGLIGDLNRNRFTILRSLTALRQLSLHAGLVDDEHDDTPSAKIDVLLEQLRDVADGGHRALVFSQFTRFLGRVRETLTAAGIEHCYLDGSTRDRPEVLRRFKEGSAPVFLISLKAGGSGLNLTEADYCFLLDPWWNPATEAQAVDRTHRIGQSRNVMVYRLVARDTIEEKVMALKARKAELFSGVMDSGEFVDTALDADDIRQLLS